MDTETKIFEHAGKVERALKFERAAINTESRTVELAFSSEVPYERSWGIEILSHAPGAMRMDRLKAGAPLLLNHDTDEQIGVIESVAIGADRVGRAVVRFSKSEDADEIFQDVVDGIRQSVSVGYMIHRAEEMPRSGGSEGPSTYLVTDWEPYEISIVSVPADISVGVGRSADDESNQAPASAVVETNQERAFIMSEVQPPAVDVAAIEKQARDAEIARVSTIIAIGEQFASRGLDKLASEAVRNGTSVDQFRAVVMEKLASAPVATPDVGMTDKETRQYSVRKAILAAASGNWKDAGFEREAHEAIAKRAGDAANGGFYVPYEVQKRDLTSAGTSGSNFLVETNNLAGSFIDMLRARSVLVFLGARVLGGLVGNVTIPRQTAASTAYWLTNEATAITESQPTIGQLSLTPKTIGAYSEISRLMLLQATPAADMLVMDDFARVLALGIDLAGLEGSGASGQPTGISNTAGIGSVTGTSIALAGIMEFQSDVAGGNALTPGCGYLTTPAVASLLSQRQRFASTDTPLWNGNLIEGNVLGYRGTTTTQITAASMIFGDFSQVIIGEWGQLELAVTNSEASNFKAGILGVRAFQTVDVGVRQAGAFSRATSIT